MSKEIFDTYSQHEDEALVSYLKKISNGRIIVFAIKVNIQDNLSKNNIKRL